MERWAGKVAVVTGASAGIGASITLGLAEHGMIVIGLARRVEKIKELAKEHGKRQGTIHAVKFDVRDIDAIPSLMDEIKRKYGGIDVMVNNAGVLRSENKICESTTEDYKDLVNVNLLSMAVFSREAIKSMRERQVPGHVFNINSTSGHKIVMNKFINLNIYSATKYGVTAFNETLRREMAILDTMIKVTSISPGVVLTEIFDKGKLAAFSGENLLKTPHLVSKDIADALIYALGTPPTVVLSEITVQHVKEDF